MSGQPAKSYSMDVSEPFNSTKTTGPTVSMGVKIGAALVSIMAFIGLVLGAYATGKVDGPTDISHVAAGRDVALTDTPNLKIHGFAFNGSIFAGTGYWTREKDMQYQRSDHATVTYNHSTIVYIFGGISNDTGLGPVSNTPSNTSIILNRTVTYDTYSGSVNQLDDMPDPRARFGYAVLGDGMYIFGGFNNPDQGYTKESAPVTTMLVFNFTTLKWSNSTAQMNLPRSDICGTAANGKIYAMGGYTYTWDDAATTYNVVSTNITEVYDPATGKWTYTTPMNQNRGDCRAATLPNGMPFAIGGVHEIQPAGVDCSVDWGKCYEFLTSTEALDTATGKWSPLAPMNRPRGDFAIDTLYDGRIFVAGGESSNGSFTHFAMYNTEEYEPDDNVWIEKAPLPEARFRFDCAGVKDRVYVFGGQPTCEIGEDIPSLKCHNNGLKTTYGYFDIRRPHLYTYVRTTTRRMLRNLRA